MTDAFDKWWHKKSPELVSGDWDDDRAIAQAAWEAALRLSAGADWVLVPREPTPEMLDAGWAEGATLCESGAPDFAAAWTAMLAAAPRHETGEVES